MLFSSTYATTLMALGLQSVADTVGKVFMVRIFLHLSAFLVKLHFALPLAYHRLHSRLPHERYRPNTKGFCRRSRLPRDDRTSARAPDLRHAAAEAARTLTGLTVPPDGLTTLHQLLPAIPGTARHGKKRVRSPQGVEG